MYAEHSNVNTLWHTLLREVIDRGDYTKPRGTGTYERTGFTAVLTKPQYNVILSPERRLNYTFMAAEFLWHILGRNDVDSITHFNPNLHFFSDDGLTFSGAYGPKLVDQIPWCIAKLTEDVATRQAVLTIWRERPGGSKDIPCTCLMQFFIRHDTLEMTTYMRSNDLWLGFPYDVFNFTMIQSYVAGAVGLEVGKYTHMVGSLHLYEKDLEKAKHVLNHPGWTCEAEPIATPQLTSPMPSGVPGWFSMMAGQGYPVGTGEDWPEILEDMEKSIGINGWLCLLGMCAFRNHKKRILLPGFWQSVYNHAR